MAWLLPFRTVEERGGVTLFIHVTKLMAWAAFLTAALLFANLGWACASHINCSDVLPTLSYMASFRPNDRLATFAVCLYSVSLPCFYLLMHASVFNSANIWDLRVMSLIALTISFAAPFTEIFDEVNLTHFAPTEKMHLVFMVGVISLACIWTYLLLLSLWRKPRSPLRCSDSKTKFVIAYVLLSAGMGLFAFSQWYFPRGDSWAAHFSEPISEYAAVLLALFQPCVLTLLSPRAEIEISTAPPERATPK